MENLYVVTIQEYGENKYAGSIIRNDALDPISGEEIYVGALTASMVEKVSEILDWGWNERAYSATFHCDGIQFGKIQMLIEMSVTKND